MITIKEVKVPEYVTQDGYHYKSLEEACVHEAAVVLTKWLEADGAYLRELVVTEVIAALAKRGVDLPTIFCIQIPATQPKSSDG